MENTDLFTEESDKSLLTAFAWWEKKRIIFNIIVGVTGLCFLLINPVSSSFIFLGAFIYGIIANVFYCLGFFIEVAAKHYFKSEIDFSEKRKLYFVFGIVISVIVTIVFGFISLSLQMI